MKRTPALIEIAAEPWTGLIRSASQQDAAGIRSFVCGLSERARYFRFFASVAPPSTSLVGVLSGSTGADVLVVTDAQGTIIGHGMAADSAPGGSRSANIGLVVTDRWQRHGLGSLLLSMLVSRAAGRGVTSLVLDVLPANTTMLGMIERRWPRAPRQHTRDAIVLSPSITAGLADTVPVPALISLPLTAGPAAA